VTITDQWQQLLATGLVVGSFYGLVAIAMQIVHGSTRILNFAQGDFVTAGALVMVTLVSIPWLNVWTALPILVIIAFVFGVVFDTCVIRPTRSQPPIISSLATVAGGAILRGLLLLVYGRSTYSVKPFLGEYRVNIGSAFITSQDLLMLVGAAAILLSLVVFFQFTWLGKGMRATAQNPEGALVVGVNPQVVRMIAFGASASVSAVAGALIAPIIGARFDLGFGLVLPAFTAAVLGGLGSAAGAVAGGLSLGVVGAYLDGILGSEVRAIWLLGALLVLLYLRPYGLLGKRSSE